MSRGNRPILKHFATTALLVAGLAGLVFGTILNGNAQAATGKIYFSPSSKSVQKGSTVTMTIRINPGTSVDTVHIVLNYDTSKLQYSSLSYSGSPFGNQVGLSISGGKIDFAQADLSGTPVSSDSFVGSVKFKALAGSGNSTLSLAGSDAGYGGPSTSPSVANGTVSFTTPSSSSGSGSSSSSGSGSSGGSSSSGSGSSAGGTQPKKPKVTETSKLDTPVITVETVGYSKVFVTATTSIKADAYIAYGTGKTALSSKSGVSRNAITHDLSLAGLKPLTTYYYQVVASHSGTVKKSEIRTVTTKGFNISVLVKDANGKPLRDTLVTLHSQPMSVKTDDDGIAIFTGVEPGAHTLAYVQGKNTYSQPVTVSDNATDTGRQQNAPIQHLAVQLQYVQPAAWYQSLWAWVLVAVVVVVGSLLFIFRDRFQRLRPAESADGMSITVGGGHDSPEVAEAPALPIQPAAPQAPSVGVEQVPTPPTGQPGSTIAPTEPPATDKTESGS